MKVLCLLVLAILVPTILAQTGDELGPCDPLVPIVQFRKRSFQTGKTNYYTLCFPALYATIPK